jgi:hypothetical protein
VIFAQSEIRKVSQRTAEERSDDVYNCIHEMLQKILPESQRKKEIEWDIEILGAIADQVEAYFEAQEICSEKEFWA